MSDEFELINEADATAPDSVFTNFGKLTWKVNRYIVWKDGQPEEVTAAQYVKAPAKVKTADGKSKNAKNVELMFSVDIQEFKPDLPFTYERKLNIGDRDWNATFKPSLAKALGTKIAKGAVAEGSKEIFISDALKMVEGKYVAYQDVPQQREAKDGKTYNTLKLVRVFKSRVECQAAMNDTVGANGATLESGVITFGVDMVKTFRRHRKEGAAKIFEDFVNGVSEFESMLETHKADDVIAEIEKLIA